MFLLEFGVVVGRFDGRKEEDFSLVRLSLDILLAITFLVVLIHFALISTHEPIRSLQKNLTRAQPMMDFLLMWRVQLSALVLLVMQRMTGYGLLLTLQVAKTTRATQ
jgi:hypothetical protein